MGHKIGIEFANQRVNSCVLVILGRGDIELIFFDVIISIIVEWHRWVMYSDKGILLVHKYNSQTLIPRSSKALMSNVSGLDPYYMIWNRIVIMLFSKLGNNTFVRIFWYFYHWAIRASIYRKDICIHASKIICQMDFITYMPYDLAAISINWPVACRWIVWAQLYLTVIDIVIIVCVRIYVQSRKWIRQGIFITYKYLLAVFGIDEANRVHISMSCLSLEE